MVRLGQQFLKLFLSRSHVLLQVHFTNVGTVRFLDLYIWWCETWYLFHQVGQEMSDSEDGFTFMIWWRDTSLKPPCPKVKMYKQKQKPIPMNPFSLAHKKRGCVMVYAFGGCVILSLIVKTLRQIKSDILWGEWSVRNLQYHTFIVFQKMSSFLSWDHSSRAIFNSTGLVVVLT